MPGKSAPPAHMRASATDDVEGIIALKYEMLGDIFDVKQYLDARPKILSELTDPRSRPRSGIFFY